MHGDEITLNDPRASHRGGVTVNALLVRENKPPKNVQPIEWVLLTSLPIGTQQQAEAIISYYLRRWMIELFFKVLKSGCKIESRRFEHIERFLPSLALYLIIAWRSLYVCRVHTAIELWFNERMAGNLPPSHDELLGAFWDCWQAKSCRVAAPRRWASDGTSAMAVNNCRSFTIRVATDIVRSVAGPSVRSGPTGRRNFYLKA